MRTEIRCLILAGVLGMAEPRVAVLGAQQRDSAPATDSVARRRIQPLPALASAPETGLQYGATVLAVWQPAAARRTRPSSVTASALRTAKSQTRLRVDGEYWTRGNAQRVAASAQWQQFPLPWYGIGDTASRSAEETFTPRGVEATLVLQQRVMPSWYVSVGARHVDQRISTDSAGALRRSAVAGTRGGAITEWSAGVSSDTRDNLFAPRSGRWLQLTYARSAAGLWSDYTYGTLKLDARRYLTLGAEHVLALQAQVTSVDGGAPFDQLALAGNSDILRGYARGRYRDRSMGAVQAEYRTPIRHHVGAVAFGGAGTVAPTIGDLAARRVLPTYGAGLRVEIDQRQRTGVRIDYGRGRDGASGLYIGFNNAF